MRHFKSSVHNLAGMDSNLFQKNIQWLDHYLDDPERSRHALIRKRWAWIWAVTACSGVLPMTLLTVYFRIWPFLWYGVALLLSYAIYIPLLRAVKNFELAINVFCVLVILTTFAVMLQLGGLTTSLGLVFVGLNCAMASVLANNVRWTVGLFVLYGSTIMITGYLQPHLPEPDYISPNINLLFFALNALWLNASTLFLILLYIDDRSRFEQLEAEQLKQLDEAKTQLYTNITHEFRTPLTIIMGMADLIREQPGKWLSAAPKKIREQSQALLQLVNQMLDLAKLEAGAMSVHFIHGDIVAYLRYLVESFQGIAESREIHLYFKSLLPQLDMDYDADKLMSIMSNLVSNALKFTPPGGEVEIIAGAVEPAGAEKWVEIRVKDTGVGIPSDRLPYIFDRFYQVADNSKGGSGGTGLGLTLTHQLVKLLHGDIKVRSIPGTETEFSILLPITHTSQVQADYGIKAIKSALVPTGSISESLDIPAKANNLLYGKRLPQLLIVEDNQEVVQYLVSILEDDYGVQVAHNGKEGLACARKMVPDIIISDVMMPEMDGFALLEQIKQDIRTSHIPVILLTARADFDSKITGLTSGADAYLVKPFHKNELFAILGNLIELRRKIQQRLAGFPLPDLPEKVFLVDQELAFLRKLGGIVEAHLPDEDFEINHLCRELGMSRAQLYRKFSALTDQSLGSHIRAIRLHNAKKLMETQGLNVTQAAFESGFRNLSHFSYVFKEEFGCSPSELTH